MIFFHIQEQREELKAEASAVVAEVEHHML